MAILKYACRLLCAGPWFFLLSPASIFFALMGLHAPESRGIILHGHGLLWQVCLFDNREVSLRDALRRGDSQQQLNEVVALALGRKQAVLGGNADMYGIASSKNRPMILIGG